MEQIERPTMLLRTTLLFFPSASLGQHAELCFTEANVRAR